MIRVKLPLGGITPEQMEAFADVIERYAPLNKAHITTRQNIQIHHIPLRRRGQAHPRDLRRRPVQPRGLRQHRAQRHRRPVGRRRARRALRPHALRRRLRALLRAPPHDAAHAAQGQDRVRRPPTRTARITGIHDIAFIARERDGVRRLRGPRRRRHVDHAARRADAATTSSAPTTASTSRSPRPSSASSTARTGCASTAPAPGSRSSSTSSASRRCASWSRRSARATGSPSATSTSSGLRLRRRRGGPRARRRRRRYASPNGDGSEFERFVAVQRAPRSARRASRPSRSRSPRRPDAPSSSARSPTSCATTRAATPARPSHQNLVLRWVRDESVYDVWQALRELGLGDAGADEISDVVSCPGTDSCKLGITSLDGPQRGRAASAWTRWRSPTRSRAGSTSR